MNIFKYIWIFWSQIYSNINFYQLSFKNKNAFLIMCSIKDYFPKQNMFRIWRTSDREHPSKTHSLVNISLVSRLPTWSVTQLSPMRIVFEKEFLCHQFWSVVGGGQQNALTLAHIESQQLHRAAWPIKKHIGCAHTVCHTVALKAHIGSSSFKVHQSPSSLRSSKMVPGFIHAQ